MQGSCRCWTFVATGRDRRWPSRVDDRASATTFLREASESASQLGRDANAMWTAFGPTNVAIHRMTAAMELGDVQVALDLAPRIDASGMPTERRVRHAIETARAYTRST